MNEGSPVEKVSLKRLFKMVALDWMYGLFGAARAIFTRDQMPLFALGVTQALVAFYSPDYGYTKPILQNEVGWFDDNNNNRGFVSSRLTSDATLVRTLVVDCMTILIQSIALIVTSFTIAFIEQWRITLVILVTYPLLISLHMSERFFMHSYGGNLSKAYLKANMMVIEAMSNIRTVAAFCVEEKVIDLFSRELEEPRRRSFMRSQIAGICYGVAQCYMFSSYNLALCYSIGHGQNASYGLRYNQGT
eukprot:Gb_13909 [translate_table: standard]